MEGDDGQVTMASTGLGVVTSASPMTTTARAGHPPVGWDVVAAAGPFGVAAVATLGHNQNDFMKGECIFSSVFLSRAKLHLEVIAYSLLISYPGWIQIRHIC
jgi:hypothetical protein